MNKEIIANALSCIKDERYREDFKSVLDSINLAKDEIENGMEGVKDVDAVLAYRRAAAAAKESVAISNLAHYLWDNNLLTEEFENAYRKQDTFEVVANNLSEAQKKHSDFGDNLEKMRKVYMAEQHAMDIFNAILNGMPKEKVEEEYAKYQSQVIDTVKGE